MIEIRATIEERDETKDWNAENLYMVVPIRIHAIDFGGPCNPVGWAMYSRIDDEFAVRHTTELSEIENLHRYSPEHQGTIPGRVMP
jgi:hypothetical protein